MRNSSILVLLAAVLGGVLFGWSASARLWSNRSGDRIEAEFVRADGEHVIVQAAGGKLFRIPLASLSDEDQEFVRSLLAPPPTIETAPVPPPAPAPVVLVPPPLPEALPGVTEDDFMRVMRRSCLRCHKVCTSVDTLVEARWIRPGRPDRSPVFTVIGKHKKPDGRYHDLNDADRKIVRDFVTDFNGASR